MNEFQTTLQLPINLIDINTSTERFVFQFIAFDDNQTNADRVNGQFGIIYQTKGIDSSFACDVTVSNVFDFFMSLDCAYDIMAGKYTKTTLENYCTSDNTYLSFTFDNVHWSVDGRFMNKDNCYKNGINFSFDIEQTDITDILNSMDLFFHELICIQGHNNFN